MTGTGLKKCSPTNLVGRLVAAASLVMEMEEVFEAKSVSGGQCGSSTLKTSALTSNFSVTASMMKSAMAKSAPWSSTFSLATACSR